MTQDATAEEISSGDDALALAYEAWVLIANAHEGNWDAATADWREAAKRWRDKFHAALGGHDERFMPELPGEPAEPPLPEGAFGRVELPGYRQHTGWVTEETRFGVQMAVIRDWDGREMAAAVIGANSQVVYLPTPRKRPDQILALTAADIDNDDLYEPDCDDEEPYE